MNSTSRIPSALILGLIAGSNQIVTKTALGTVVFSAALAPYAAQGTRIVLLGNAVVCLFIALGSGFRGAVGTSPPEADGRNAGPREPGSVVRTPSPY